MLGLGVLAVEGGCSAERQQPVGEVTQSDHESSIDGESAITMAFINVMGGDALSSGCRTSGRQA